MSQHTQEQPQHSTPTIKFDCTAREIALIVRLRKFPFGTIEVHKIDGELTRTIKKQNELLTDDEGLKEVSNK
jgi:hypothetical protein